MEAETDEVMTTVQFKRREHTVKTWPGSFQAQLDGDQDFNLRFNDRMYNRGDILRQKEFEPTSVDQSTQRHLGRYTGREMVHEIVFVLNGYGLQTGFVALQLRPLGDVPRELALEISDRPRVEECFRDYADNPTADAEVTLVQQVLREARKPAKRATSVRAVL